jgi:hypothetical protein
MRSHSFLSPVSLIAFVAACSSGAAPASPDAGGKTPGMDSGSTPTPDSGKPPPPLKDGGKNPSNDSGAPVLVSNTYSPPGCSYQVTIPTALGYTALSADDNASAGPASTAAPIRVRLGMGGGTTVGASDYPDPTTTAAFTWETGAANTAAKVKFGSSATALTTVQEGYNWTVPASAVSGAAYFHEAHICGLSPATTYYYAVGGGAPGAEIWSTTQSFTTLPATGPITIAISGDARDTVGTWQLLNERIKSLDVSAHLFTGDIVLTGSIESEYVTWLDAIWKDPNNAADFLTLGQLLYLPVNGNHEDDSTLSFANFAVPGSGQYAKTFGSYDIGPAHFVFVDDMHIADVTAGTDDPEADAQVAWVTQDLTAANADRTNHPFIFVLSHRGMFSTSNHSADPDVLQARTTLAPIYSKYNVDAVFNGHDHEYERTYPIVPGTPITGDPTVVASGTHGTTYVICAGAGASPYAVGTGTVTWRANHIPFGTAATSAPETTYVGMYQTMTLTPKTASAPATALVNVYALIPGGGDTTPIDTFTLTASGS